MLLNTVNRVGWGYLNLGQFGSLFSKWSILNYIDTEKVYSFRVNNNFMELVLNHLRETVLQQLQQLQQQLEFSYFEKKTPIFFFSWDFLQPEST